MDFSVKLPIEDNGAYIDNSNSQIHFYLFDEMKRTLKTVWISSNSNKSLVFPQIDFNEKDFRGIKTIEEGKEFLASDSNSKLVRKKQKEFIEDLSSGKIIINNGAFDSVKSNSSNNSLVVTGNASIRFNEKSFGNFSNFTLILPKDMGLFLIADRDLSRHGVCSNERYVIANKIINPLNEEYSDEMVENAFEKLRVVPQNGIKLPNLQITVSTTHYYDRDKNAIVEYAANNNEHAEENKFVPTEYGM